MYHGTLWDSYHLVHQCPTKIDLAQILIHRQAYAQAEHELHHMMLVLVIELIAIFFRFLKHVDRLLANEFVASSKVFID